MFYVEFDSTNQPQVAFQTLPDKALNYTGKPLKSEKREYVGPQSESNRVQEANIGFP